MGQKMCLSVLVLTEDTGKEAIPVVVAILKKIFGHLVPGTQTHKVQFDPQTEGIKHWMQGNLWKCSEKKAKKEERHSRIRRVAMYQQLAAKVMQSSPPRFVVVHIDGDRAWSSSQTSENAEKFQTLFLTQVRRILEQGPRQRNTGKGADQAEIDAAMDRIFPLIPFYSIESWLYQNWAELRCICEEKGNPAKLLKQIDAWQKDPQKLEDMFKPKDNCDLKDSHNKRLATKAWPADAVNRKGLSFAATVDCMRQSQPLLDALESTKPAYP